jgi:hypothetical protein
MYHRYRVLPPKPDYSGIWLDLIPEVENLHVLSHFPPSGTKVVLLYSEGRDALVTEAERTESTAVRGADGGGRTELADTTLSAWAQHGVLILDPGHPSTKLVLTYLAHTTSHPVVFIPIGTGARHMFMKYAGVRTIHPGGGSDDLLPGKMVLYTPRIENSGVFRKANEWLSIWGVKQINWLASPQ